MTKPFTDQDLASLKEEQICVTCGINILSLIARLEAAEKVVGLIDVGGFQLGGALVEWRKAAGK